MLRRGFALAFCFTLIFSAVEQHPAFGQTAGLGEAVMTASAFHPIPDGSRIALQLADDTDINLRLRDVAERTLRRAGYDIVSNDPAFTLRLETARVVSGNRSDRSIGSLRAGSGIGRPVGNVGGPQGTGVDLNLKLWSSTKNSLLSPKSAGAAPRQGFGVQITAFDEAKGKPAWQGFARAADSGGDSFRAGSAMIRHLVDAFGLSVEAETVSLR